jgi:hypothetical protein
MQQHALTSMSATRTVAIQYVTISLIISEQTWTSQFVITIRKIPGRVMFCVCLHDFLEIILLRFSFLSSLGEQKLTKADGERGGKSPSMNFAITKGFRTTYVTAALNLVLKIRSLNNSLGITTGGNLRIIYSSLFYFYRHPFTHLRLFYSK